MRTQTVYFSPELHTLCVFPDERSDLSQAISELQLKNSYPVIVLIGDEIDKLLAAATQQALETISGIAQELGAVVICGATTIGLMAAIGPIRKQNQHTFPLIGIAPEGLVSMPGGPKSAKFLWWGSDRRQLQPLASHFLLVPGSHFGDESAWMFDTAIVLSQEHQAVTILINGGEVARKDVELSLENDRPVIVLSRTGHLADALASQPLRHELITVVPASNGPQIVKAVHAALAVHEKKPVTV